MATVAPSSSTTARVDARALTARLVSLIEHDHLSVAQAARNAGVALEFASTLVRLHAIELEAAESELDDRLEDLERQCPGEDWWSYSDRQQTAIIQGSAIPNRIIRELVEAWQQRTKRGTAALAVTVGISDEALRRSLGMVAVARRVKYGRLYPSRTQKTITIEAASRVAQALGIPPCEVCGL